MDGFMKYSNVAGFVCHIVNVIVVLYSMIFFPESTANFYSGVTYIFWLLVNVNGLLFSASAGIVVNHMVRVHPLYCKLAHYSGSPPALQPLRRPLRK